MINKLKYLVPLALVATLISCRKEFLDINSDPNNPVDAPVNLLLTSAQRTLGDALAMGGGDNGGLSQLLTVYVHQITTREDADQYGVTGNEFYTNLAWPKFYASSPPPGESFPLRGIFQNLEEIIRKSDEDGMPYYRGIARVMKAYGYSQLADVFGDIPFSEANRLDDPNNPIIYPKFDDDADIYPALLDLLDEAIADLSANPADNVIVPEDDDVIYKGNVTRWIKAANTVKLKLYTQMRLVEDVSGEVAALLAEPDQLLGSVADNFQLPYGTQGATDDRNPAYAEYYATQRSNHISPWFYEIMMGMNPNILSGNPDPRIPYYWYNQLRPAEPAENQTEYRDGAFATIYFGSVGPDRDRTNQNTLSVIGLYPAGGRYDDGAGGGPTDYAGLSATSGTGSAPYRFITYADRLYLEAELIHAGLAPGNLRGVFEAAMLASFRTVDAVAALVNASQQVPQLVPGGNPTAEVADYIDAVLTEFDNGDADKKLELIMTQKWIQAFGSAVDPYTDYRRTGFPVLFDPTNPAMAPGGQVQPPPAGDPYQVFQKTVPVILSVPYPLTLPWVRDELQVNPNAPAQKTPSAYKPFWLP